MPQKPSAPEGNQSVMVTLGSCLVRVELAPAKTQNPFVAILLGLEPELDSSCMGQTCSTSSVAGEKMMLGRQGPLGF